MIVDIVDVAWMIHGMIESGIRNVGDRNLCREDLECPGFGEPPTKKKPPFFFFELGLGRETHNHNHPFPVRPPYDQAGPEILPHSCTHAVDIWGQMLNLSNVKRKSQTETANSKNVRSISQKTQSAKVKGTSKTKSGSFHA